MWSSTLFKVTYNSKQYIVFFGHQNVYHVLSIYLKIIRNFEISIQFMNYTSFVEYMYWPVG